MSKSGTALLSCFKRITLGPMAMTVIFYSLKGSAKCYVEHSFEDFD